MRSRKQSLKIKSSKMPFRPKDALRALKRNKRATRNTRLLLSQVRYLRLIQNMKRGKKLAPRVTRYR